MRRFITLLLCVAGVGVAAAPPGSASSVEFEYLQGTEVTLQQLQCDPGGISTATFLVRGIAGGPHPGSFESSLTLTAGSQQFGSGELLDLNETFRIASGDAIITGTKHLVRSVNTFYPFLCSVVPSEGCEEVSVFADVSGDGLRYEATIAGPDGIEREEGYAEFRINADGFRCAGEMQYSWGSMDQFFTSVLPAQEPVSVVLEPLEAANPVDTFHELTATVVDADGQPVSGAIVRFSVTGTSSSSGDCTTNGNGQCLFSYQVAQFPGSDTISAYVDTDADGSQDEGEPSTTATKIILLPASTPGRTSGGGQFITNQGNAVTFTLNARSDGATLQGDCTILDKSSGTTIRCLDVFAYVQHGGYVTIFGQADQNGTTTLFRISVEDRGTSGTDLFTITTTAGYVASGTVTRGDINTQ